MLILTTLLHQRQEDGKQLSARQRSLAERMITRSDNVATEALLAEVGRDEVRRVGDLVGMDHTHMDDGWWGLWRTTPGDLNAMVAAVLSSDAVLDGSRRAVARFLMADVIPEQRWGVFAPESSRVHVAAKNGWGPLPDGYRLNSAGWVSADDREYQLAILSNSPDGFRYGRRTISEVGGHLPPRHGPRPGLGSRAWPRASLDRRRLLLGGAGGVGLGALGAVVPATASAAGIDTRAALARRARPLRRDPGRRDRAGAARQPRRPAASSGDPLTLQSYSTIKVLILVAMLRRAQNRGLSLTSTQKSLASRMIRYSDNAATDTLLAQIGVSTCQVVADHLGLAKTVVRGGSTGWWGHSTTTTGDLVQLMNQLVRGTYLTSGRRDYVRELMAHGHLEPAVGARRPAARHGARRAEERLGADVHRVPAQLVRARLGLRPQLPAGDPVQEPERLQLRQDDDQPGVAHRLRRARPPADLTTDPPHEEPA